MMTFRYLWLTWVSVIYVRLVSYLCYLCLFAHSGVNTVLTEAVTWRVSYKRQGLLTLWEHLGLYSFFGRSVLLNFLIFCVALFHFILFFYFSICVLCVRKCQCLRIVHSLTFIPKLNIYQYVMKRKFKQDGQQNEQSLSHLNSQNTIKQHDIWCWTSMSWHMTAI